MPSPSPALARAETFCEIYNLRIPIVQAPMAGAFPASLAIAVANTGGLGGCGALMTEPAAMARWGTEMSAAAMAASNSTFGSPIRRRDATALPRMPCARSLPSGDRE